MACMHRENGRAERNGEGEENSNKNACFYLERQR